MSFLFILCPRVANKETLKSFCDSASWKYEDNYFAYDDILGSCQPFVDKNDYDNMKYQQWQYEVYLGGRSPTIGG